MATRRMQVGNASARAAAAEPVKRSSRPPPQKKRVEEIGRGFVSTQVKDKQGVYHEEEREVDVLRETFADNEQPAFVKVGAGMTINLGNFESLRIDCSVTLPCHPENIDIAYETASEFVSKKIDEEQSTWLGEGNQRGKR